MKELNVTIDSDGYPKITTANKNCKTCNGFGICDDGWIAPLWTPCPTCFPDQQVNQLIEKIETHTNIVANTYKELI